MVEEVARKQAVEEGKPGAIEILVPPARAQNQKMPGVQYMITSDAAMYGTSRCN